MPKDTSPQELARELEANERELRAIFVHCDDVVYRFFTLAQTEQRALIVFISNLVNKNLVETMILRELMINFNGKSPWSIEQIHDQLLPSSQTTVLKVFSDIAMNITTGKILLLVDGETSALALDELTWEHRGVEKSDNEVSIRGSQEAFTENMMNNIALIRRFLPDARLKVERNIIGNITHTPYCILYLEGIADPQIIAETKTRLQRQPVEQIMDSGYIEELIRDTMWSPFPTVNATERPDRTVAQLLEGRVAILVENSPIALTVPALFIEFLQVPEDYYQNFLLQSAIRILRHVAFWLSLLLPSFYVAIINYHNQLIPDSMLSSLVNQRMGVPFPTVIEVFAMEVTFEILREAGLRLPRPIGQAISIVGALVVGQAAVQAGIVMASTVIIVATTGIASFTIPGFAMAGAVRLLRFPILILTGLFGLPGFTVGLLSILFHITSLRSFGVVYTDGLAPRSIADLKDSILRAPLQMDARTRWVGRGAHPTQRKTTTGRPKP